MSQKRTELRSHNGPHAAFKHTRPPLLTDRRQVDTLRGPSASEYFGQVVIWEIPGSATQRSRSAANQYLKRNQQCPECGSNDGIADAKAIDRNHGNTETKLSLATLSRTETWLFKGPPTTTLAASTCTDCGCMSVYADSPHSIKVAPA